MAIGTAHIVRTRWERGRGRVKREMGGSEIPDARLAGVRGANGAEGVAHLVTDGRLRWLGRRETSARAAHL